MATSESATTVENTEQRQQIIDRIRKLLALSDSNNEAEAALAAARAQELLQRHSLSLGVIGDSSRQTADQMATDSLGTRVQPHIRILAKACNTMFDVRYFKTFSASESNSWRSQYNKRFVFIGLRANVEAAIVTHAYLLAAVYALAKQRAKEGARFTASAMLAITSRRRSAHRKTRFRPMVVGKRLFSRRQIVGASRDWSQVFCHQAIFPAGDLKFVRQPPVLVPATVTAILTNSLTGYQGGPASAHVPGLCREGTFVGARPVVESGSVAYSKYYKLRRMSILTIRPPDNGVGNA